MGLLHLIASLRTVSLGDEPRLQAVRSSELNELLVPNPDRLGTGEPITGIAYVAGRP